MDNKNILYCCGLPETYDDMISCTRCGTWFHYRCKGIESLDDVNIMSWVCSDECKNKRIRKMKRLSIIQFDD